MGEKFSKKMKEINRKLAIVLHTHGNHKFKWLCNAFDHVEKWLNFGIIKRKLFHDRTVDTQDWDVRVHDKKDGTYEYRYWYLNHRWQLEYPGRDPKKNITELPLRTVE